MFGFGKKKIASLLGVDVGASGVKLVELSNEGGRARLLTYGYTERDANAVPLLEDPAAAGKLLADVWGASGAMGRRAVAALPLSQVFTAVIAIPSPKTQEAAKPILEVQARKLVPLPLEEMVLSWTFIDPVKKESVLKKEVGKVKKVEETGNQELATSKPEEQKNVRVLLSAAPKSLVSRYVEIFRAAKLELTALDLESFGLIRSLIGKDRSTVLLVDMGAVRTNLTVVEKGIPFFTRSVQIGGNAFTGALAKMLSVSESEAAQMKFDLAMSPLAPTVPDLVKQVFGELVNEVRYVFEQYKRQEFSDSKRVEKLILTGGSAHLPGIARFFVDALGVNAYVGDPWARVAVPEDVRLLLETVGPSLAIAVGLAMRENE
ncbi:pilus assembly protein PilM [Candidatus Uhrbacteria bacterium]|nr:pilus assembly protein PilM [Candidatus Uhrbacteria bacterium]